ncbi:hypothetical protein PHLGIDRAFT_69178 [Phlebiopsis gigantea 11061_1 CR5-6]|uniref:Uncharacterized protein n=1 Tax=Phlebiopsis gigantea (strain 11061_1 CR5-6) TaxID=745531 RepID=A0A0C3PNU0_PHLG1|nr:hypothetical protein PHLGIDRAFT_69178 [Phlebiopsis gigantea 11061_1 CR5-6]
MRIAFSVPHHQEYIRSGTPSEPILAEVAAMGMHRFDVDAVDVVGKELASGLIDGNTRTGLVARLLLIMAYDRALKNLHARERTSIASYSRAVPVRDFLQALVAEDYISDVLGCKPDEAGDPQVSLEEAFDGAFVRFSHFARNGVDNAIDTHAGLAAVARGMAIQCCEGRGSVDIVVPIVLKDEKLKEDVMSTMLIQVVNDRDGRVSPLDITAGSLGVFPRVHNGREEDQRPYIVIAMQLGAMASAKNAWFVGPSRTREVLSVPRIPLPCRPGDLTARSTHRAHPRYYINIEGCSHKVYGVISEADSPRFAGILAAGGLFSEHSRPELEAEVQELKPEWNRNRACYGWTDQPELWSSSKEGERIVQEKIVCGAATAEPWKFPARKNHQVENICET